MTYQDRLKEHYKAVKLRLMKNALPEKKELPPPMPESPEPQEAGLVSANAEKQIVTEALTVSEVIVPLSHMQTVRLAEELMGSPRLPPLPGLVIDESGAVRWMRILSAVAHKHGINPEDIMGKSRRREIVNARFEVFYRLRVELAFSYKKISHLMKKDHTTVLHGVNKIRQKLLDEQYALINDEGALLVSHPNRAQHTDLSAA